MSDGKDIDTHGENAGGSAAPADAAPKREEFQPRRRINPKSPRQALQPETLPPPPPRSKKARHPLVVVLNFFLMIGVLTAIAAGSAFYFGKLRFTSPGPLTEPKSVLVAKGANLETIAGQLKRSDVIDSDFIFSTAVRLYKSENKLKAGEYLFEPGVSMQQVLDDLVSGRSVLHSVSVPEGLTNKQALDRVRADESLVGDIVNVPGEGWLAPDTYKFTRGATRQQIVDQMARRQKERVKAAWERRSPDLPVATEEEFLTLASIVEKETGRADERPRVAAVFINRLREGMRLQSDPTIVYGLFGGDGKPADRPILRSDIDKQTPYNTYQIDGLPPGPIANPGKAALEAVANPSRTEELYFVADGTGGHVFSKTLDEHNRNVARWRRIEAAQREAVKAAAAAQEAAAGEASGESAPAGEAGASQ